MKGEKKMKSNLQRLIEKEEYDISRDLRYVLSPGGLEKTQNYWVVSFRVPVTDLKEDMTPVDWLMSDSKPEIKLNKTEADYLKCIETGLDIDKATFADLINEDLMAARLRGIGWFEGVPLDVSLADLIEVFKTM